MTNAASITVDPAQALCPTTSLRKSPPPPPPSSQTVLIIDPCLLLPQRCHFSTIIVCRKCQSRTRNWTTGNNRSLEAKKEREKIFNTKPGQFFSGKCFSFESTRRRWRKCSWNAAQYTGGFCKQVDVNTSRIPTYAHLRWPRCCSKRMKDICMMKIKCK